MRAIHRAAHDDLPFIETWVDGVLEVNMVHANEFSAMAPTKQKTLQALGFPVSPLPSPVWLPHLHGVIVLPDGCDRDVLRRHLADAWPAPYQIHLEQMREEGRRWSQVTRFLGYASKFELRRDVAGEAYIPWDRGEVAEFLRWTAEFSPRRARGFRFSVNRPRPPRPPRAPRSRRAAKVRAVIERGGVFNCIEADRSHGGGQDRRSGDERGGDPRAQVDATPKTLGEPGRAKTASLPLEFAPHDRGHGGVVVAEPAEATEATAKALADPAPYAGSRSSPPLVPDRVRREDHQQWTVPARDGQPRCWWSRDGP
jgi:hypothetical protein